MNQSSPRKKSPKQRLCKSCQKRLPPSLFQGKSSTCLFCRFSNHNPLRIELDEKTTEITRLEVEIEQIRTQYSHAAARALERSGAQTLRLLDSLSQLLEQTDIQKSTVKRSVYFQSFTQISTLKWLADELNIDASLTASLLFELLNRSLPLDVQTDISKIARKEESRTIIRKQVKSSKPSN